jgi:hypothetical protein
MTSGAIAIDIHSNSHLKEDRFNVHEVTQASEKVLHWLSGGQGRDGVFHHAEKARGLNHKDFERILYQIIIYIYIHIYIQYIYSLYIIFDVYSNKFSVLLSDESSLPPIKHVGQDSGTLLGSA